MRGWRFPAIVLSACAAAFMASGAAAQSAPVNVEHIGGRERSAEPGGQVTLTFRVTNRTAAAVALRDRVDLPGGWRLVIPEGFFTLAPRAAELRFFRVALPPGAFAGRHLVRYAAGTVGGRDSVLVVVANRRRLFTRVETAPRIVAAGEQYNVTFIVRNVGNAPAVLRLAATASDSSPVRLDSSIIRLAPERESAVRVTVRTNARLRQTITQYVRLFISAAADTARREPEVAAIEVVPRASARVNRFHRVPAQLTVRRFDDARYPTGELRGGGLLSQQGDMRVDFLARGPQQNASMFGDADEYWIAMNSGRYHLWIGDQPHRGSRLREFERSAFGVAGKLALGPVTLGAFSERDRRAYAYTRERQHGANAETGLGPGYRASVSYVSRSGISSAEIWKARAIIAPSRIASLDGEVARSRTPAGTGAGLALALTGGLSRISYAVRRQASDSGFAGHTRGTAYTDATVSAWPLARLQLSGSIVDRVVERRAFSTATERDWQRSMEGSASWDGLVGFTFHRVEAARMVFGAPSDRRTGSVRLFAALPLGAAHLHAEAEEGVSTLNEDSTRRRPSHRLAIRGGLRNGANSLSLAVERMRGMPWYLWTEEDRSSATLSAQLRVARDLRVTANVTANRYRSTVPRTNTLLDIGVVRHFGAAHRAAWRGRMNSYGPTTPMVRRTSQWEYVVPVGLPVGRTGESGAFRARLVDHETGRPVAGALVRIGEMARFSDAAGGVSFTGLAAGSHYVEVDRATLGQNRMTTPATPLAISLKAGDTKQVEIRVMRGIRVHGSIRLLELRRALRLGAPDSVADAGPYRDAIVELTQGADTLRTALDAWGRFTFVDLPSGKWQLQAIAENLPRHHRLDPGRLDLDLRAGETRSVEMRVVHAPPAMQVIAREELTVAPATTSRDVARPRAREAAAAGRAARSRAGAQPFRPRPLPRHSYTVSRLDRDLAFIAGVMYGDSALWPKIWVANRHQLATPRALRAGQRLVVPDSAALSEEETRARDAFVASLPTVVRAAASGNRYTVTRWDIGLADIASKVYGDSALWPKIWLANRRALGGRRNLVVGVRLLVPEPASLTPAELAARDEYLRVWGRPPR